MDRFLNLVPKNVLAFVLITVGILFIVLSQPPHTVCDSQVEVLKANQLKFLYKNPKLKTVLTTRYETLRDHCKATNSPGGCFELFQELRILLHDLSALPKECLQPVAQITEYSRAVRESADLVLRLAWGDAPPASYNTKFHWLEPGDVSLFCEIKVRFTDLFGEEAWNDFREDMMQKLPGAKDLTRNQIWDLSLFSENCAKYP